MQHIVIEVPELESLQNAIANALFEAQAVLELDCLDARNIVYEETTHVLNGYLGYGPDSDDCVTYIEDCPYCNEIDVVCETLEQRRDWQFLTRYYDVAQLRVVRFDLCLYIQIP